MTGTEVHALFDLTRQDSASTGPRPVRVHLTRPAEQAAPPPVVLLSHGTGGSAADLDWLARPLARAGFLTVAVDHHGNNHLDGYTLAGFACWWDRPLDLSLALDHVARNGPIGPVGVAGFSLGGYTGAALLGATVVQERYRALLGGDGPLPPVPEYPDLERERRGLSAATLRSWTDRVGGDYGDDRVRCAFLLAPAVGPMLAEAALARIRRPVAVRWGDADDTTVPAENARRYVGLIPGADGRSAGADVGHYDFLDGDPGGEPVRARVAVEAVAFFRRHLAAGGGRHGNRSGFAASEWTADLRPSRERPRAQ